MKKSIIISCVIICCISFAIQSSYQINKYFEKSFCSSPQFSPDNRSIYFLSDISGINQVWRISINGDELTQITDIKSGIDFFSINTDEGLLFYGADDGGNGLYQLYLSGLKGENPYSISDDKKAIYRFGGWSEYGKSLIYSSNKRDSRYFDIYLFDLDSYTSEIILEDDSINVPCGFSPNNRFISFIREGTGRENDLLLMDLEFFSEIVQVNPDEDTEVYSKPVWKEDSTGLYFISNADNQSTLCFYETEDKSITEIYKIEGKITDYGFDENGECLYIVYQNDGYDEFKICEMRGMEIMDLYHFTSGDIKGVDFSSDGEFIVYSYNRPDLPDNLYLWEVGSYREPTPLLDYGTGEEFDLFLPQVSELKFSEEIEISAYIYRPEMESSLNRFPMIIYLQDGLEGNYQPSFNPALQYYVNNGYGIAIIDISGFINSGGEILKMNDVSNKLEVVEGIDDFRQKICSKYRVDNNRLIISGSGLGGLVALNLIADSPDLWSVCICYGAVSDISNFIDESPPHRKNEYISILGESTRNESFKEVGMNLFYDGKLECPPLIIIYGMNDSEVDFSQQKELEKCFLNHNAPVYELFYPGEGHIIERRENIVDLALKTQTFIEMVFDKEVNLFTNEYIDIFSKKLFELKDDEIGLIDEEFKSIDNYINSRQFKKAEIKLEQILSINKYSYSAKELKKILTEEQLTYEGMYYYQRGDLEKSLEIFKEVENLSPKNRMIKDYIYEIEDTIKEYEEEKTRKEQIETLISSAETYTSREQFEIAIRQYRKVLELDPDNYEIERRIQDLRERQMRKTEEEITVEPVIDVARIYKEGSGYIDSGKYIDGINLLERVYNYAGNYQKTVSKLTTAYFYLGIQSYGDGFLEDAIGYWTKIIEIDPSNQEVRNMISRAEEELKGK